VDATVNDAVDDGARASKAANLGRAGGPRHWGCTSEHEDEDEHDDEHEHEHEHDEEHEHEHEHDEEE